MLCAVELLWGVPKKIWHGAVSRERGTGQPVVTHNRLCGVENMLILGFFGSNDECLVVALLGRGELQRPESGRGGGLCFSYQLDN